MILPISVTYRWATLQGSSPDSMRTMLCTNHSSAVSAVSLCQRLVLRMFKCIRTLSRDSSAPLNVPVLGYHLSSDCKLLKRGLGRISSPRRSRLYTDGPSSQPAATWRWWRNAGQESVSYHCYAIDVLQKDCLQELQCTNKGCVYEQNWHTEWL